jgi:hypothetical protein
MNFICNFCKEMPKLPAKLNSPYLSPYILEWNESSLETFFESFKNIFYKKGFLSKDQKNIRFRS